jgi:hypothetical protein
VRSAGGSLLLGGLVSLGLAGGAAAAASAAVAAAAAAPDPRALTRSGMEKFAAGDVEGSVRDFDAALAAKPSMRPYLWQRGLSLYYLEQHGAAAQQFRDDVAVNPNDTEEAIWAFLAEARAAGPDAARRQFLRVGRDPRPVMRAAEAAFRAADGRPEAILAAAGGDAQGHDAFYAALYAALWHEAHGEAAEAEGAMARAVQTQYARQSGDYMAALARVHCARRGWARPS